MSDTRPNTDDAPVGGRLELVVGGMVGIGWIALGVVLAIVRNRLFDVWVLTCVLGGFALLTALLLYYRARGARMDAPLRRLVHGYHTFLTASLLAGNLLLVNVLVARYGDEPWIDASRGSQYTLQYEQTKQLLAELNQPVAFTVLMPPESQPGKRIQRLLDLYREHNEAIRAEFVDPYRDANRWAQLQRDYSEIQPDGVLIRYGVGPDRRHRFISRKEIFEESVTFDRASGRPRSRTVAFHGEDVFTSALNGLLEGTKQIVYFTTGHGEKDPEKYHPQDPNGIGKVTGELEKYLAVHKLDLKQTDGVPEDCDVLVVAGPAEPFTLDELERIATYLERGPASRLIVCVDPGVRTGLEPILKHFGVELRDDMIVDPRSSTRKGPQYIRPAPYPDHPIGRALAGTGLLLHMPEARSIGILPGYEPPEPGQVPGSREQPYSVVPIIFCTPYAWGETQYKAGRFERDRKDHTRELIVGVAVKQFVRSGDGEETRIREQPRMVVIGDSDFAANRHASGTNLALLMNAVNWLRGRTALIGSKHHSEQSVQLRLQADEVPARVLEPSLLMLVLILAGGLTVWWVRNRL